MPHPYVDSATVANNHITLRVEVTDFGPTGGYVTVSGQATQVGGALAVISQTTEVPSAPNGDPDDANDKDRYFVTVTADAIAPNKFKMYEDITVFVAVARVWLTVLGRSPHASATIGSTGMTGTTVTTETAGVTGEAIAPGTTWALVRADARYDGSKWPSPGAAS